MWFTFSVIIFFFKQKTAYEIGLGIPAEPLFRSNVYVGFLIQRNQSAAFSSGKVRPNHETNINIIARRTGKDVNRSEERRVGKECRSRCSRLQYRKSKAVVL